MSAVGLEMCCIKPDMRPASSNCCLDFFFIINFWGCWLEIASVRWYPFFWLYLAIGSRQPLRFSCGQQQTLSPKLPCWEQRLIAVILLLAGRFCWFGATEDLPHFPVYILPEHFASCALHSTSTAAKWCFSSPGYNGKYFSSRSLSTFRAPSTFRAGNV